MSVPLVRRPLACNPLLQPSTHRQSYDVDIEATLVGEGVKYTGSYDLKNPNFRYMQMPPPPPGTHHTSPTQEYFEPGSNGSYVHATVQQQHAVALAPQPHQIISPVSAGGTVVVSAMTPHPVMAVHAAPPGTGMNGVALMNGGVLSPSHASSKTSNGNMQSHHQGAHHLHSQPLLQSPPPGHTHLQSTHGQRGLVQPLVGGAHHQQYIYASTATAVGTMGNPHYSMYKFHQVHPGMGAGQGGHTHSTY